MSNSRETFRRALLVVVSAALVMSPSAFAAGSYDDLVSLLEELREFQEAVPERGVRQYTPAAVATEYEGLQGFQQRLAAFDALHSSRNQVDHF